MNLANKMQSFQTSKVWHMHIKQNQMDLHFLNEIDRFHALRRKNRAISFLLDDISQCLSGRSIIISNQDRIILVCGKHATDLIRKEVVRPRLKKDGKPETQVSSSQYVQIVYRTPAELHR